MPAILKVLIVFASILALSRSRAPLGLLLTAGGVVLDLWAGVGVPAAMGHVWDCLLLGELWLFLAVTCLIIELGRFMTADDNAAALIAMANRWGGRHGRALSVMALPAAIGLVPMPAGALFSAPLVEQASAGAKGDVEWKSAVNYWFRHVWEYWWPLYPGVIVTMSIFSVPVWCFMAIQIPFSLVAIAAGFIFLVRPHLEALVVRGAPAPNRTHRQVALMLPLALVTVAVFLLPPLLSRTWPGAAAETLKLAAMLIGLLLANGVILIDSRRQSGRWPPLRDLVRSVTESKGRTVLITLTGVLMFKNLLACSGLLPVASSELLATCIPVSVAVAVLPFLAGLVTGLALGFAGTAFPLVVGLMAHSEGALTPLSTLALAFGFGYMGMMLSPVHLCLLVTKGFFDSSLRGIYRHVLPCVVTVAGYSVLAHVVLALLKL